MNSIEEELAQLKISSATETETVKALSRATFEYGGALALWRLPLKQDKNLIIDFSGRPQPAGALEELGQGFLLSPFKDGETKLFINADLHYNTAEATPVLNPAKKEWPDLKKFTNSLNEALNTDKPYQPYYNPTDSTVSTNKAHFIKLVEDGIVAIENDEFKKVVPSRCKVVNIDDQFDVIDTFDKLCNTYPNAFVSLVSIPGIGTWLGATPELLIGVTENKYFKTVSLAGTQKYIPGIKMAQVAWTQKEIEEQAIVSRYIINCFKRIRLREFEESGPKTIVAGNLMHLKTSFEVDMEATNFPQLGAVMLELLHPTSAVCGMPKAPALAFLREREQHERSFFSGYLGPVDIKGDTNIFVNLRCMHLLEGKGVLYAGAGITEDSIPEKEWEETEMKINTILNIITPEA